MAKQLKEKLLAKKIFSAPNYKRGLSTGSTLVNLACSGKPTVGFLPGKYIFLVGDSASGKTFLALTMLAEASINPEYKDYRLIYDNAEDGALMDLRKFFGEKLLKRIEAPKMVSGDPDFTPMPVPKEMVFSTTVEVFYDNLDDAFRAEKPFIYVLDSMDSLSSEDEQDKFAEQKAARRKGKDAAGSYGDGKAKKNSSNLRQAVHRLKETGSILIIIAQTRDNLGFGAQFNPKTRSGGRALRFYATEELWFSIKEGIKKTVHGKPRKIGTVLQIQVKKNRQTGREPTVEVPFYPSFGFDDVGSCVDFLIEEKRWNKEGTAYNAAELSLHGSEESLVKQIEEQGKETELRLLVAEVWQEIEEACGIERKRRYE